MRSVAIVLLGASLLAGCSALDKINPFSSTGVKIAELEPLASGLPVRSAWQASVGSAGDGVLSPAIVGDSAYAAARDGVLVRIDAGRQVWRVNAGQAISGGVGAGIDMVVVGTIKGEVLAFSAANGAVLWKSRVDSEVLAAPTVLDTAVIVRGGDSRIYALNRADGKRRWTYQRATPSLTLRSNVGVSVVERAVIAGFPGGKMVAIDAGNGAAIWEATVALPRGATELERIADVTSNPAADGRDVCGAAYQGRVACFDLASGNPIWTREISSRAGVAIDGKYVYVTDDKGAVHALDRRNGASVWKQDKLLNRSVSRPLVLGDYVAVGDVRGVVHFLRREDGAFAARALTDDSAISADPQRLGRELLVQTRKGGLYALAP